MYVDDYPIGTTPISTDFVYYGTRKVRIVKSGYETLTVLQPIPAPWYQYPVLDFITENVVPGEIRDERVVEYQLQPQVVVPSTQILGTRRKPATLGGRSAGSGAAGRSELWTHRAVAPRTAGLAAAAQAAGQPV